MRYPKQKAHRKVEYADKQRLEENILRKHSSCVMAEQERIDTPSTAKGAGTGTLHTPLTARDESALRRRSPIKTGF